MEARNPVDEISGRNKMGTEGAADVSIKTVQVKWKN